MKLLLATLLAVSSLTVACASHSTKELAVAKAAGRGTTKAFAGACAQHWPNVRSTASRLGLDTEEENAPRELLASFQKRGEMGGNLVGVFLEDGAGQCTISVVSMRRDEAVANDNDWDQKFFVDYRASK